MPRRRLLILTLCFAFAAGLAITPASAIESGRDAVVRADGDCLRLRASASTSAQVLTCLPEGAVVSVLPGSLNAEGYAWRLVSVGGQTGWVVEQYLQQPAVTAPAATGALTGLLPTGGGGGLIVWGGGGLDAMLSKASRQGCEVVSLWVTDSAGQFVSHIVGAPDFVNAGWSARYPGRQLPARSPYIALCNPGSPTEEPAAPPPPGAASIAGDLPAAGGFGLVVWAGGSGDALASVARGRGCDATSVWTNDAAGQFISYIPGAPDIANAAWAVRFPGGGMPGDSAVVVVCRGKEAPPSTDSGPVGIPGLPEGIPALPPGPAGNR